jgi:sugar/nucleoside kinase (ribokinase family)
VEAATSDLAGASSSRAAVGDIATAVHSFVVHRFIIPPLPAGTRVVNPIGAGDTVAGVTLHRMTSWRWPLPAAFADGLAAGSASCLQLRGAEWAAGHAADVRARLAVVREEMRLVG